MSIFKGVVFPMYMMLDKANFRGISKIPGNLAKDVETIKDEIKTVGRRLDWDVRAKADVEKNLKTIIHSMDEYANQLKAIGWFLIRTHLVHVGMEREIRDAWEAWDIEEYINLSAPLSPGSIMSTAGAVYGYMKTLNMIRGGFNLKRFANGDIMQYQKFKNVLDGDEVKGIARLRTKEELMSAVKDGKAIDGAEFSKSRNVAVKNAFFNKLGAFGIGWEAGMNAIDNMEKGASTDKIVGDAIVDVAVGAGTAVAGALIVSTLPVSAPLAVVGAAGLGVSVGLSYITDGIKWADYDNDGKRDTFKDMVKHETGKLTKTVAGWFK